MGLPASLLFTSKLALGHTGFHLLYTYSIGKNSVNEGTGSIGVGALSNLRGSKRLKLSIAQSTKWLSCQTSELVS